MAGVKQVEETITVPLLPSDATLDAAMAHIEASPESHEEWRERIAEEVAGDCDELYPGCDYVKHENEEVIDLSRLRQAHSRVNGRP